MHKIRTLKSLESLVLCIFYILRVLFLCIKVIEKMVVVWYNKVEYVCVKNMNGGNLWNI